MFLQQNTFIEKDLVANTQFCWVIICRVHGIGKMLCHASMKMECQFDIFFCFIYYFYTYKLYINQSFKYFYKNSKVVEICTYNKILNVQLIVINNFPATYTFKVACHFENAPFAIFVLNI